MKSNTQAIIFSLLISLFCVTTTYAATVPVFDWVNAWGDSGLDYSSGVVADADGNLYVGNYFAGTVDFDPGAGTTEVTSNGAADAGLSKFSSDGTFEWVKTWGGSGDDNTFTVLLADDGGLLVVGRFQSTVDFDPGAGTTNGVSNGGYDVYLLKLDADGIFEWVKTWGGAGNEMALQIVIGADGGIYAVSNFSGTVDFDPGAGTTNGVSNGGDDVALSHFDADGTFEWVKTWGGAGNDSLTGVNPEIDSAGNVYITGMFANTVDLDPGAGTTEVTSAGSTDAYISKFTSAGILEWAKAWGGTGADGSRGAVIDSDDAIYVAGNFVSTVDFDPGAGTTNGVSNGSSDASLSKFSSDGTFEWVKTWGGAGFDTAYTDFIDSDDGIYIRGEFANTVDFDPSSGTRSVVSNGASDNYISRFSPDGTFEWVAAAGGTGSEFSSIPGIFEDTIYTTGWFQTTVDFDPSVEVSNKTADGSWDAYLLALNLVEVSVDFSDDDIALHEGIPEETTSYTIELSAPPVEDVTITIDAGVDMTTDIEEVTFASTTWNVPQTITVTVVNDEEIEGTHTATITHTTASDEGIFDGLEAIVSAEIQDDDHDNDGSISGGGGSRSSSGSQSEDPEPTTPAIVITPTTPSVPVGTLTPQEQEALIAEIKVKLTSLIQELIKLLQAQIDELLAEQAE